MSEDDNQNQVYHHRINKGGMDDILSNQRLKATEARAMAGGSPGVRAHSGPLPEAKNETWTTGSEQNTTTIEFKSSRPPDYVHPTNGQATWRMEDGEYLNVEVTKVQRGGVTIDSPPKSEAELNAMFEARKQQQVAQAQSSGQKGVSNPGQAATAESASKLDGASAQQSNSQGQVRQQTLESDKQEQRRHQYNAAQQEKLDQERLAQQEKQRAEQQAQEAKVRQDRQERYDKAQKAKAEREAKERQETESQKTNRGKKP